MNKILIDLNNSNFQSEMFELQKDEQRALLNTLKKISKLNWSDFYKDKGIRWELIKQNQQEDVLFDSLKNIEVLLTAKAIIWY